MATWRNKRRRLCRLQNASCGDALQTGLQVSVWGEIPHRRPPFPWDKKREGVAALNVTNPTARTATLAGIGCRWFRPHKSAIGTTIFNTGLLPPCAAHAWASSTPYGDKPAMTSGVSLLFGRQRTK